MINILLLDYFVT